MKFADTLKNLRELNNVTQQQLAKVLEVSRATIAGYETKNHQPDYEKLEKIASYFQVPIGFLITGESFEIESKAVAQVNERLLDSEVASVYKTLSLASKQDTLKYMKLLQLKDKK